MGNSGWKIIQKWEIEWSGRDDKCGLVDQTSIRTGEEFSFSTGIKIGYPIMAFISAHHSLTTYNFQKQQPQTDKSSARPKIHIR